MTEVKIKTTAWLQIEIIRTLTEAFSKDYRPMLNGCCGISLNIPYSAFVLEYLADVLNQWTLLTSAWISHFQCNTFCVETNMWWCLLSMIKHTHTHTKISLEWNNNQKHSDFRRDVSQTRCDRSFLQKLTLFLNIKHPTERPPDALWDTALL